MKHWPLLAAAALLAGCTVDDGEDSGSPPEECPTWYADLDGDGFGNHLANPVVNCTRPPGHAENNLDCNDQDPDIHPDAVEVCDPFGIDEDCNGLANNDDPNATGGSIEVWPDKDGDGFGDANSEPQMWCEPPEGWSDDPTDCDDDDPNTYPGAAWEDSVGLCMRDADGDGFGDMFPGEGISPGTDCDDTDSAFNPLAVDEFIDGIDENCDFLDGPAITDNFDSGGPDMTVWSTVAGNVRASSTYTYSGSTSMDFWGSGGTMETIAIDASLCPTSILWEYQGLQYDVDITYDWLYVEYWDGSGWIMVDRWEGGITDRLFHHRMGIINDPAAMHAGLKIRIRGDSTLTSESFFVDDFRAGCIIDTDFDGMPDNMDCAPNDPLHWSDCGLCVDGDGDGYGANCDLGPDCDDTDPAINGSAVDDTQDGFDQNCDGIDGNALFFDDFENNGPASDKWAYTGGTYARGQTKHVGQGQRAVEIEYNQSTSRIESQPFDTSTCPAVSFSFLYMTGGEGNAEAGDFLHFEWWDGNDWVEADRIEGYTTDLNVWKTRRGFINHPGALHPDLQIRFRGNSNSSVDHWYVDVVSVGCAGDDADGDGVPHGMDCDDNDGLHWSDCGMCVDLDGDGRGIDCDLGPDCDETDPNVYFGAPDPIDGVDTSCDGRDGRFIADGFESGAPHPYVWSLVEGSVSVQDTYVGSGSYALDFSHNTGVIESSVLDTSTCSAVVWSYLGKLGDGDPPDTTDYLYLEYYNGWSWILIDQWAGGSSSDWMLRWGLLDDPTALTRQFKIRFRGVSSIAAEHFYVDDVLVACADGDNDGDGLPAPLDCDDTDPFHWLDCGECVDLDGDGFGPLCDMGPDCDDNDPDINPLAADTLMDGYDQNCDGVDGPPMFFDDFENNGPASDKWAYTGGTYARGQNVYAGQGNRALEIEYNQSTSRVESQPFDTTTCDTVSFNFIYMTGGAGNAEGGDFLHFEWWNGSSWVEADRIEGYTSNLNVWFPRRGVIDDPAALRQDLQIRFRGNSNSSVDHWYVDVVNIGCTADDHDGDGYPHGMDCDDADPDHWSDCGLCQDLDGDGYGLDCDLGIDCDETRTDVNAGGLDDSADGIDQDCNGIDGIPLLEEDFEGQNAPDPSVFTMSGNANVVTNYVRQGARSIDFFGRDGMLTSTSVDTTSCTYVVWRFEGMTGGAGNAENGDFLHVEYWDGLTWNIAYTQEGSNATIDEWRPYLGVISDPGALTTDFKFRIRGDSNSTVDHWYIDQIQVGCSGPDNDGDSYPVGVDCDDNDFWHWFDCGRCIDNDGDGFGVGCDLGPDCDDDDPMVAPPIPDLLLDGQDPNCDGLDLLGWREDFETGGGHIATWGSHATLSPLPNECGPISFAECGLRLRIDGNPTQSETHTVDWDSTPCTAVGWAFEGQRSPISAEIPEANNNLYLEWNTGGGWVRAYDWLGGAGDAKSSTHNGVITDPAAISPNIRFRLIADSTSLVGDVYYIDNFRIGCAY